MSVFVHAQGTLQMFAWIYRVFTGKLECGDIKFMGIACILGCPRLWRITKNSLHNEGIYIYKCVNLAPVLFG